MNSAELQKHLNGSWTAQDVCTEYGVTAMTVHLWRARGLPAIVIPGQKRPAIRFVPSEVKAWTRTNGVKTAKEKAKAGQVPRFRPALAS